MTNETKPVKQMSKKRQSYFATRSIFAFLRRCVGIGALPNVSMYEMAAMALEHHGYPKPDKYPVKVWCKEMVVMMREMEASDDIAKLRESIYELSRERSANKVTKPKREVSPEVEAIRQRKREKRASEKASKVASKPSVAPKKKAQTGSLVVKSCPPDMAVFDFVKTKEFLDTFEWRRLRYKVLRHYGAQCMCCGATPGNGVVMNVDHVKPRKYYPELALDFDNLQIACNACNHGKSNEFEDDWRPKEAQ